MTEQAQTSDEIRIPRVFLLAVATLMAFTISAILLTRFSAGDPPAWKPSGTVVESRDLRFEDRSAGAVAVLDVKSGETVALVPAGTDGFIKVAIKGLARGRMIHSANPDLPFRLSRFSDGRIELADLATGQRVDVVAFGHGNARSFEKLLTSAGEFR